MSISLWTWLRLALATGFAVGCGVSLDPRRVTAATDDSVQSLRAADEASARIEAAMFARVEFLGAQALVPYPTAEARQRVADLTAQHADEPELYRQLAQLDEQLGRIAEAKQEMRRYVELRPNDHAALQVWADFLQRRAEFADEAAVRERLLRLSPATERAALMSELIALAQTHELGKYLQADFYREVIDADAGAAFEIVGQLVEKLRAEKSHGAALAAVRQYRPRFPARLDYFIEQETAILIELNQLAAAEQVYRAAFDPFWPDELAEQFYQFLAAHDRYRAYGHELREAFRRDPTDFDIALRLLHYDARGYGTGELPRVVAKLEGARARRAVAWQPEELATLARFMLAHGHGDIAARLLYTLHARGELGPGSPVRAKILYQLFELLSDAGGERLALTRGDLKFYEDVATSDPHPGLLGGVLSLIFSDSAPRRELRREEAAAVEHFNRAAAQRIFQTYKAEYPTAPELAQMYLDLVRLHTAGGQADEAAAVLGEFETRHADDKKVIDYPSVALKLADTYIALNRHEDERRIYRRVLDHLGARHSSLLVSLVPTTREPQFLETMPVPRPYPFKSNQGIHIPHETDADGYGYPSSSYRDHLRTGGVSRRGASARNDEDGGGDGGVTYAEVLERYVASLAHDEKANEILELYAGELRKYPDEPGLYEQMLQWLGQAKLVDEQLRVYREALRRFPTVVWRDRLARWYLRHERRREFADYSRQLLAQLGDAEAASYLVKFVGEQAPPDPASFDAQLYLGLYRLAHERFPRDLAFVNGLLKFYSRHERWTEWRALLAEHYFVSREIREQLLSHLASRRELRAYLEMAREKCRANNGAAENIADWSLLPYRLFRADAAAWLSNYEEAVDAYRELNRLYPTTPEFAGRLAAFTRSLGQSNRKFLEEAGAASRELAEAFPASADYRTQAGEIQAELGDYGSARGEWEQLLAQGAGEPETYLNAATVYWDYFQYDDALRIIRLLRERQRDESFYAFQAGVLLEAKRQTPDALIEYVKALGAIDDPYDGVVTDAGRARRRLQTLARRPGGISQLLAAFARVRNAQGGAASSSSGDQSAERGPIDDKALVINIAGLLREVGDWPRAAVLLRTETNRSRSREFLEAARDAFSAGEDTNGERLALRRLADVAGSPRFAISYRLQLVESYQAKGQPDEAARALGELVLGFSSNYGVLSEAADIYWQLGRRADSLRTLRDGMTRGRGRFRYAFARKLAARELDAGRMDAAAAVLNQLHAENPLDLNAFHELASVLVRSSKPAALRAAYQTTLAAVAEHESDHKERRERIAALREQMIRAFTRLQDYEAAINQHIEIINRNPEDEASLEAALRYAQRYGGGERLLDYYQRTAAKSYKNFRWHLVLARIHEARADLPAAVVSYRHALAEQPAMIELHAALAAVHTRQKDYGAASDMLAKACELSNDDPQYLTPLVAALEQANRHTEAAEWRKRLPVPVATPERRSLTEQFARAARLGHAAEQAHAVAAYRRAFDALAAAPLKHELKASEIAGYVRTVREEENLAHIAARLFALRDQLVVETAQPDALRAQKARARLQTLDGALPETIGAVAAERATGDELSALLRLIEERLAPLLPKDDQHGTLALLQNLSRRAGFGHIEEQIMLARLASARAAGDELAHHTQLRSLVNLYADAGNYHQVVELLETEQRRDLFDRSFGYAQLVAEYARLDGDQTKELQALRSYFSETSNVVGNGSQTTATTDDPLIERFFDALTVASGAAGRNELRELADQPGAHHWQLINYLIKRDERELAHAAITSAPQSVVWQLARNAEVGLALGERERQVETYFVAALGFRPIGELIERPPPDTARQLSGDDWFHLAGKYGQWLHADDADAGQRRKSRALLPATLENRPRDAGEQARLGRWYLNRHDHAPAAAHLWLALEAQPDDITLKADLGAAYFALGDRQQAAQIWQEIIGRDDSNNGGGNDDDSNSDEVDQPTLAECQLYLETLSHHGLAATARARVTPLIIAALKRHDAGQENSFSREDETEAHVASMLRALAVSFRLSPPPPPATGTGDIPIAPLSTASVDDAAQARLFRELCEAVPDSTWLPELLLREALVAPTQLNYFYRLLISRSDGISNYDSDYEYAAQLASRWDEVEAEAALDHEKSFDLELQEPTAERFKWQREYLRHLMARGEDAAARRLVAEIELILKRRYARPVWLRLARLRLEVRDGRVASALAGLRRLAGIDAHSNLTSISAPDAARVAAVMAMLKDEHRAHEAEEFLAAAYARQLALAQFDAPAFAGLARLAFTRGDTARGLQVLRQLIAFSRDETRPMAEAELIAEPWIKVHAITDAAIETPAPRDELTLGVALRVAAEVATAHAQWETAVEYRQQLFDFEPEDEANRIELARALAFAGGREDEVVASLAVIIGDRRATRFARWQAVWSAPEILGARPELWSSLTARVRQASPADVEMQRALVALAHHARGRLDDALAEVRQGEPAAPATAQFAFLVAALEGRRGHDAAMVAESLSRALINGGGTTDGKVWQPFAFAEDEPRAQLLRLYAAHGRPRAALELAGKLALSPASTDDPPPPSREGTSETNEATPSDAADEQSTNARQGDSPETVSVVSARPAQQSLEQRAERRRQATRTELLGLLAACAEELGEVERAIGFERARLALTADATTRRTIEARLLNLLARQNERRQQPPALKLDGRLVAAR